MTSKAPEREVVGARLANAAENKGICLSFHACQPVELIDDRQQLVWYQPGDVAFDEGPARLW
eukprot:CAMPEP_0117677896 /NCGR_PEP_ID=MMETSP0804-20121206/16987_1 /TAXON_ID=1074897 /ORGANISM="Tetraselmis astigmatica, Strain CCMP880" /LENGTH=61 /DNA_ID=CAMNT_0005487205 /DNA_START=456 /DNA_END=638 /DNA_ORIENTATION=+